MAEILRGLVRAALLAAVCAVSAVSAAQTGRGLSNHGAEHRLPLSLPPEIWAWGMGSASSEGYEKSLDVIADQSNFGLLSTKAGSDVTSLRTYDHVRRAVEYAHSRGIRLAPDLDVRRARGAFYQQHPGEQQWMLRARSFSLSDLRSNRAEIAATPLHDHTGDYSLLSGRLLRVYRVTGAGKGEHSGLVELQDGFRVLEQSKERVSVEIAGGAGSGADEVIVVAAFEYRTPDVYSPALLPFQTQILEQYREVGLDGAMKDEWGFPPVYNHGAKDGDFWFSEHLAAAYAKSGGGEFVRDCVLMTLGIGSPREQRLAAVNRYMRLILTENSRIEDSFYRETKRLFGPDAFVVVHATWGNMPHGDAFKNGYDWWQATRDYGQTDESWPLPIRTSLAKKMGGPVWYNQIHEKRDMEPIYREIWQDARAGGRVNFLCELSLLQDKKAMRAESRVRLLNYISHAPLDCPVAVVFGHAAALNWVGPHFGDLGVDFAESLWALGVRADVIPSSEIESGALQIGPDGQVSYGVQKYSALVFVNPEYEPDSTIDFLRKVGRSKTYLFIRGHRTLTFDGQSRGEKDMMVDSAGADPTPARVAYSLGEWHAPLMARYQVNISPLADQSRLTDGTSFLARGERDPAGDLIDETFYCGYFKVTAKATGVFGIKLSQKGDLEALAASDLRLVEAENFRLELAEPVDLALWRENGRLRGVVQGVSQVPATLLKLTDDWTVLQDRQPR